MPERESSRWREIEVQIGERFYFIGCQNYTLLRGSSYSFAIRR
jgi:hypothetical protein